jgi:hypothetical protein
MGLNRRQDWGEYRDSSGWIQGGRWGAIYKRQKGLQAPVCYRDKSYRTLYCIGWRLQDSAGRFVYG